MAIKQTGTIIGLETKRKKKRRVAKEPGRSTPGKKHGPRYFPPYHFNWTLNEAGEIVATVKPTRR